jgi:hypothetical protein
MKNHSVDANKNLTTTTLLVKGKWRVLQYLNFFGSFSIKKNIHLFGILI